MKITSVELHPMNSSLSPAVLSFRDPSRSNRYNVKGITGLDADDIVPRFYGSTVNSDEALYNLSLEDREIVILIQLNPNYEYNETPSSLRDDLYKLIGSSRTGTIQVQFKDEGEVKAAVTGFVTKLEAALFSKEPEVQITISCDDPFLRPLERVEVDLTGFDSQEFNLVDSLSTAPHGFRFTATVATDFSILAIQDSDEDPSFTFGVIPAGGFDTGDVVHFSSELNEKEFYLVRGLTTIHLADAIYPGSVWPTMFPGDNNFVILYGSVFQFTSISYYPTYWGI